MKLAFSTVACPDWTLEQVAAQAEQWGYQGVELRTLAAEDSTLACDPARGEPKQVRDIFRAHGIEPICLSTSLSLHEKSDSAARRTHWQIRQQIDAAAEMGCGFVRLFGYEVEPGQNRQVVLSRIARRLMELADYAGQKGVQILMENAGSFNTAKQWWWMFNLIEHPMVGMCWNVANAAAAGESPAVSVPLMHSRIKLAKVKDTVVGEGSGFVPLGEGTVGIEHFVQRLLGVGFGGYITVEWDRAWLPSLAPAEEYLPDARERLSGWLDAIAQEIQKAQEKAAKAAARK